MFKVPLRLLGRAIYSNAAMRELYALRQSARPAENNRGRLNLGVTSLLLLALMSFIFSAGRKTETHFEYLQKHAGIALPASGEATWSVAGPGDAACPVVDCFAYDAKVFAATRPVQELAATPVTMTAGGPRVLALRLALTAAPLERVASGQKSLVVSLPMLQFHRAEVFLDGRHFGSFYDRERLQLGVEATAKARTFDILLELEPGQKTLLATHDAEPLFVSGRDELTAFQTFRAAQQTGRGDYAGAMARIVMAIFMLVLFLFVDGTPESLGLAVFFGFEAFALSLKYGWLPVANVSFLANYAFQMGDLFRLYFFLQLARVVDRSLRPWLVWGSVLCIPYGLLRHYEVELGLNGLTAIPIGRDIVIGLTGAFVCLRAAASVRGLRLPWREVALYLAAFSSVQQTMDPLRNVFPVLAGFDWYVTLENFLTPLSVYLIALSALINISTLENRVRTLSSVQSRAQEIEREMELGRTVQRAFLTLPPLPENAELSCHHEAISFVSGDSYYVHWDDRRRRLVFLLNDVTGHGVQAALKASACNAIANSVWRGGSEGQGGEDGHLLAAFERAMQEFLARLSDAPDITAMVGAELDMRSGSIALFRANTNFPILVEPVVPFEQIEEPHLGERWRVRPLVFDNRALYQMQLVPGTFVLFLTDGFVVGSRDLNSFVRHLRVELAKRHDGVTTAEELKDLALRFPGFGGELIDDRTMLVCQWLGPKTARQATTPHLRSVASKS